MDLDLDRKSIVGWVESAPEEAGAGFIPAKEKFLVEMPIGEGGMGEVFLVTDRDLKRQVAMKVLRRDVSIGREQRLHFIAEAQATSQLEHPGIPPVHDLGLTPDGRLYFTMKLVSGRTLREVLHDLALKRKEVAREYTLHKLVSVLERICETMNFAHERGVIHRDLKPENVMLGDYGEVHVMDWGLARVERATDGAERIATARELTGFMTDDGTIKGTLPYMSPEQARAEALDRRSDVYALGCLLYEVLTLQPAFDPRDKELLARKQAGDVVDVASRNPRRPVPEPLAQVCRKAMATVPAERYPTAGALAGSLRAWLDGRAQRERRHEEAEALAKKGAESADGFHRAQAAAREAEAAARAEAARHDPWRPVAEKRPLLEARSRAREARVQVALSFAEAAKPLEAAVIAEEENASARAALSALWKERLQDAERRGDESDVAYALEMIRRYHVGEWTSEGTLTLVSDPPGARGVLYRYVERDGVLVAEEERGLGGTPLGPVTLAAGSYLCVLRKEGFRDTRYPVRIARGGAWEGEVRLRTDDEIGDGFVYVPGGPFLYGEGGEAAVRSPPDFAIAKHPVTFREYAEFLDAMPEDEAERRKPQTPGDGLYVERGPEGRWRVLPALVEGKAREFCLNHYGEGFEWRIPVMGISWDDAVAYCAWKTRATGREWRLPTEEEREKAARGVDGRRFAWGEIEDASLGKCRESRDHGAQPEPVGAFPASVSVYGMGDASGGMWDWTDSWFDERRSSRVLRGGSWNYHPKALRCAYRGASLARGRHAHIGLRCARSLSEYSGAFPRGK